MNVIELSLFKSNIRLYNCPALRSYLLASFLAYDPWGIAKAVIPRSVHQTDAVGNTTDLLTKFRERGPKALNGMVMQVAHRANFDLAGAKKRVRGRFFLCAPLNKPVPSKGDSQAVIAELERCIDTAGDRGRHILLGEV